MNNQKIWFTSDSHFGHKNILKFSNSTRGTKPIAVLDNMSAHELRLETDKMDETLIKNWNSRISENDVVYHLGDFSFAKPGKSIEILSRLNGRIHLIKGNHEQWLTKDAEILLESVSDYKEIKVEGITVCMFHYPIKEWNKAHRGAFHLFGHVHGKPMNIQGKALDVGIDNRPNGDMMPWSWDEVKAFMEKQPIIKHH